MTDAKRPLTQRLKEDNWDLHQIAEHAEDGPSQLIMGTMPKDKYVAMLGQELLWHRALDAAITDAKSAHAGVAKLVPDDQLRASYIEQDLSYFGVDVDALSPTAGTQRLIDHIESIKGDPMAVFGLHYVRTGAANGNRFVAKKVRKTFDFPETGEGTNHLDPWGDQQRTKWETFKRELDEVGFTQDEQDRMFNSVRSMYVYAINMNSATHRSAEELLATFGDKLDKAEFDASHTMPAHN